MVRNQNLGDKEHLFKDDASSRNKDIKSLVPLKKKKIRNQLRQEIAKPQSKHIKRSNQIRTKCTTVTERGMVVILRQ